MGEGESLTLQWARTYLKYGWRVIPLQPNSKVPLPGFPVLKYRSEPALDEDLEDWFTSGENNIAILTGKESMLTVIDVDKKSAGKELAKIVTPSTPCLRVTTPRPGRHLYFQYYEGCGNKAGLLGGIDVRGDGGYIVAPPSTVDGKQYKWDKAPNGAALPEVSRELLVIIEGNYKRPTEELQPTTETTSRYTVDFSKGKRDVTLYYVAACLKEGGMKRGDAEEIVVRLGDGCDPPFPKFQSKAKVSSAYDNALPHSERSITDEIKKFIRDNTGMFTVQQLDEHLEIRGKGYQRERKARSVALTRLSEKGIIVKMQGGVGRYRVVDTTLKKMDLEAVTEEEWDVHWPFNLEQDYKTLPKTIACIAGTSNAGKSGFLLQFCYRNAHAHSGKIHYYSNEMGPMEIRSRTGLFDHPSRFAGINFYERSNNYADAIALNPNHIHIVDYLEPPDGGDFFKMGYYIDEIFRALGKGIALIAIQKNPGALTGVGGARSIERARLYLTLDNGVMKIAKIKNLRHANRALNGIEFPYRLDRGCRFMDPSSNAISEIEY